MTDSSATSSLNSMTDTIVDVTTSIIETVTATATTTTTKSSMLSNDTIYDLIRKLLNGTELYKHQIADLIEPEKYSVRHAHAIIWTFTILTYLLAIPVAVRIVRTKAYLNLIDYFSFHIVLCAFVAWIPSLILLLYHWFQLFTLRLCRLHYVFLSTNETVPLFFVLYMIIERFLYAHPSFKQKCRQFSRMYCIHLYAIFTWLFTMLIYALASPFNQPNPNSLISVYSNQFCPYNYSKLSLIATTRSIIYFCLFLPAVILIGFVLRYFYLMRGTNQVPPIEKLWTIRVTSLLCTLVFYDVYLYYLEHIAETYRSFLLASVLRSTFYLIQLLIIIWTEPYWIEIVLERCACLFCFFPGQRRKPTTPVPVATELEINSVPYSPSAGHYSLVDDTVDDEFERTTAGPEPTLRIN